MSENRSKGACAYCGRVLTRVGMGRHLPACEGRKEAIARAEGDGGDRPGRDTRGYYHVEASDAYSGSYWLHLEVGGSARLEILDAYLRAIWLECCGHLSRFTVGDPWRGKELDMRSPAYQVLRAGKELTHVYDFGSSTETRIRVVGRRTGVRTTDRPIELMARNEAPTIPCAECGEPASRLCMECVYEYDREGTLCPAHAARHDHEAYGDPMPLVNSPRTGVCGYEGPAEPPW